MKDFTSLISKVEKDLMVTMKKIDRRVLRTRQSLGEALINLTLNNGYDSITIKELTQEASIGYATFFRHFKSKDELLMYVLESVLEDLNSMMESDMTPYEQAKIMFEYIGKNDRIYQVFVNLPRNSALISKVHSVISHNVESVYKPRDESLIPMEVAVNHIVTSIIELIRWWITNDMKLSADQMATIQSELIVKATELVALDHIADEMVTVD